MSVTIFGTMRDGERVLEVTLRDKGLSARVISWGAALRDLRLVGGSFARPLVLGFEHLDHYILYARNHGANVGRYGGRTRNGRLVIDGQPFQLSRNLNARHHLHGGFQGLGRRNWTVLDATASSATLMIVSPNGDEGYPGTLSVTCRYELCDCALSVELTATADQPTPVNILHHSYFNLDGTGQIAGHRLQIDADTYLEFDDEGLPTGRILPVTGSDADFGRLRALVDDERFDTSFVLAKAPREEPVRAATLLSSAGDLAMQVFTTEPGLHFYNGFAAAAPVAGLDGRPHLPCSGLCLEATRFNDAINLPALGDVIVRPGEAYRQKTLFSFEHRAA